MKLLPIALCTLALSVSGLGQVAVREDATRARLVEGKTTISLALRNTSAAAFGANVSLQWLSPSGTVDRDARQTIAIPPGESVVEMPLPLPEKRDALFERLVWVVSPGSGNYTAFLPIKGALSFPNIADYAFTLGVVAMELPRAGKPYELRVLTNHPVTKEPVAGVAVSSGKASAMSDRDGIVVLHVVGDAEEDGDDVTFPVKARRGDFGQSGESTPLAFERGDLRIYTDKPLYQPGQTMHIRILALGGSGGAAASVEHEIGIKSEQDETEFATTAKTSRFGIASVDWEIPGNAKSGRYRIVVKRADQEYSSSHAVAVRRYELPPFRVTVRPDHPYYLLKDKALVEVRADYLFGKPVNSGTVRISVADEDKPLIEGKLDAQGHFQATIEVTAELGDSAQFVDNHYMAFVTDASTNRIEQRKFDLRVSRESLHIYVVRAEATATGQRVYVSSFTPDGAPVRSDVEVLHDEKVVARGHTNRLGLARIEVPTGEMGDWGVRAVSAAGRSALQKAYIGGSSAELWLETNHSLYRRGEPVRCHITAERQDALVLLLARNGANEAVFSASARLKDGSADVEIPYSARFGRVLSIGAVAGDSKGTAGRRVLFPGPDDLVLRAEPGKGTYRPGETATVRLSASSEAALGIAIVDESVLERVAADQVGHQSEWSNDNGWSFGGITERGLMNLDPAKIDDDLQLVAAAFMNQPAVVNNTDEFLDAQRQAFMRAGAEALKPIREALDANYLQILQSPRDEGALCAVLGYLCANILDPWMQPYRPQFATEGADNLISFVSAGPDKRMGTGDDYVPLTIRRKWFANYEALIRAQLDPSIDLPAATDEFFEVLNRAGLRFAALRDPWGNPLQVHIEHRRDQRHIVIDSSGPDHKFGTADDVHVADFAGRYFRATTEHIQRVLDTAQPFPHTPEELQAVLKAGGIDFAALRDPWGRNYFATFDTRDTYTDKVQLYSYAEYRGAVEERKKITPVRRTMLVIELHSPGDDGIRGTYDDFNVATFTRVVEDRVADVDSPATAKPPAFSIGGAGTITGVVTDPSGAVIPRADVTLDDVYVTHTDGDGRYFFRGVKPGAYRLTFQSPGFQSGMIEKVPAAANHVTRVDWTLRVGTTTEMVDVAASAMPLQTESAEAAVVSGGSSATSTPRVREYFPETLFWQPELVTDAAGHASLSAKLADTVTTWHVAVIGSTVDGRISETTTEIRAFQPFLVDLDVPPVLTSGDEIELPVPVRNYLEVAQKVTVSASVPPQLTLRQPVGQPGPIESAASANALVSLRANAPAADVRLRVTALAKQASDAIEKPVSIHPDGQRRELSVNDVATEGRPLLVTLPATAMPGTIEAQVKFYPSLLARLLESMEPLLTRPHGCGEQTISSAYPNLLFLRALREAHLKHERLEAKALKNLNAGYRRLLGYQDEGGGFTYWGNGEPDIALTAYALNFLRDAQDFMKVDTDRVEAAEKWLAKQKPSEHSTHGLQVGALIRSGLEKPGAIDAMLGELARKAAEFDDPYAVAAFASAALDAGKLDVAQPAVEHLRKLARDEQGAAYWSLRANTPFHGWGRWGQVETTALSVSALAKWSKTHCADPATDALIQRGALFLLRNADADGSWATTQATVRVLAALLDLWAGADLHKASNVEVVVNGTRAGIVAIPAGDTIRGPVTLDVSRLLKPGTTNEVSFAGLGGTATEAQSSVIWYETWGQEQVAKDLRIESHFSTTHAAINEPIRCDVLVSRQAFRGYGMVIANIGLPPGAEVDRGTLASAVEDPKTGVDSFEVAPDHVTLYIWPRAADSRVHFVFRPRFAMKARANATIVYDYYNPDERMVLAPALFEIQ